MRKYKVTVTGHLKTHIEAIHEGVKTHIEAIHEVNTNEVNTN